MDQLDIYRKSKKEWREEGRRDQALIQYLQEYQPQVKCKMQIIIESFIKTFQINKNIPH